LIRLIDLNYNSNINLTNKFYYAFGWVCFLLDLDLELV